MAIITSGCHGDPLFLAFPSPQKNFVVWRRISFLGQTHKTLWGRIFFVSLCLLVRAPASTELMGTYIQRKDTKLEIEFSVANAMVIFFPRCCLLLSVPFLLLLIRAHFSRAQALFAIFPKNTIDLKMCVYPISKQLGQYYMEWNGIYTAVEYTACDYSIHIVYYIVVQHYTLWNCTYFCIFYLNRFSWLFGYPDL